MAAILASLIVGLPLVSFYTTRPVGPTPVELSDPADGEAGKLQFEQPDLVGVEHGLFKPLLPGRLHRCVDEARFPRKHSGSAYFQRGPPTG